jgi:serpin B
MPDVRAWFRRWLRTRASAPAPLRMTAASPDSVLSKELDPKVDAAIAVSERSVVHADPLAHLAHDNNAFALAVHGQLYRTGGNQFFSPFSIRTAVLMAYLGARLQTADQVRKAAHVTMPDAALYKACGELQRRLAAVTDGCEVAIANAGWSREGAPIEAAFSQGIREHFGGSWHLADFLGAAEAARAAINDWVCERTRGRIADLLPPGSPGTDTYLLLVNAVYFRGKWRLPFDPEETFDKPFYLDEGRRVMTPLMHQTARVRYLERADYQAISLAYQGTELALLVILPRQRDGLEDLEQSLSTSMVADCLAAGAQKVDMFLPRFTLTWGTAELSPVLRKLGMPLAFTRHADFSGIYGRASEEEPLFISRVYHKAFIEVNEQGTEAAAATAAEMLLMGIARDKPSPIPVFRADHPFLFAICDQKTGAVIFLGRLVEPEGEVLTPGKQVHSQDLLDLPVFRRSRS